MRGDLQQARDANAGEPTDARGEDRGRVGRIVRLERSDWPQRRPVRLAKVLLHEAQPLLADRVGDGVGAVGRAVVCGVGAGARLRRLEEQLEVLGHGDLGGQSERKEFLDLRSREGHMSRSGGRLAHRMVAAKAGEG